MTTTARESPAGTRLGAWAAALTLVFVPVLASCADDAESSDPTGTMVSDGDEPADPPADVAEPAASFSSEVTAGDTEVAVSYHLTNDGDEPLLVVDRLPTPSGSDFTTAQVYVSGQDDGRVLLSQRVFPWPDSDRINYAQAPQVGVTTVAPGETVSADVAVPLPLERRHPFGQDIGYGEIALPGPVTDVVFCLGVIPPPFEPSLGRDHVDGVTTVDHGNESHEAQYLFCSKPTAIG